jgi:predicted RNase H-like HicB family nuclease
VTQGETLDEVAANVREAVQLLMEDGDGEELGLARDATVIALMELETAAHRCAQGLKPTNSEVRAPKN